MQHIVEEMHGRQVAGRVARKGALGEEVRNLSGVGGRPTSCSTLLDHLCSILSELETLQNFFSFFFFL